MTYANRTQHRWLGLPHTATAYVECVVCEQPRRCMTHADYPGMPVCYDCFDDLAPPVDDHDHANHWDNGNWDAVARSIGREVVPHGVLQDGRYYPAGTNPPANRPNSMHVGLTYGQQDYTELRQRQKAAQRRAFVAEALTRLKS